MISANLILAIHENLTTSLKEQGFHYGNLKTLEKIVKNLELFEDIISKASYLWKAIIGMHIFKDGNKRTAGIVLKTFLNENNLKLSCSDDILVLKSCYIQANLGKYPLIMEDTLKKDEMFNHLVDWLKKNTMPISP